MYLISTIPIDYLRTSPSIKEKRTYKLSYWGWSLSFKNETILPSSVFIGNGVFLSFLADSYMGNVGFL